MSLSESQKKIELENYYYKKQLAEIGQKFQADDLLRELKLQQESIVKKEQDYQKIVLQWNQLCDKMENVLSENRLLRELANLPENFGINIEEIKLGDRMKIEDYKARIRILQKELDELESERARLKHKLVNLSTIFETNDKNFNLLTPEQKISVLDYIIQLTEGRTQMIPERYELMKENHHLKMKIEMLEKQLSGIQVEQLFKITNLKDLRGSSNGNAQSEGLNQLVDILLKENENLKNYVKTQMDKIDNINFNNPENQQIQLQEQKIKTSKSFGLQQSQILQPEQQLFSYLQLPPVPLVENDFDHINYAYSYRLNTKIKLDQNKFLSLFGVVKNEHDLEGFKVQCACLQVQLLETLEVLDRLKGQDRFLKENVSHLFLKLEKAVLLQNELFEKYVFEKKNNTNNYLTSQRRIEELVDELAEYKRKSFLLDEALRILETRDLSLIERKALDKMKENAILEVNFMKLGRKYDSLMHEDQKNRKFMDDYERQNLEKDKQLENTIIQLKQWKAILMDNIKFLIKKLKNSVQKSEFDSILAENKSLRERQRNMIERDIDITKKLTKLENLRIQNRDLEQKLIVSEDKRVDCELESNYLRKKVETLDPEYALTQNILRRIVMKLQEKKYSFQEIKSLFDPNNNTSITKKNFIDSLLKIELNLNQRELEIFLKSLDYNGERNIDSSFFMNKLSRLEFEEEKDDEVLFSNLIEAVRKKGVDFEILFKSVESIDGFVNKEIFKLAFQTHSINFSEDMINKIVDLFGNKEDETINYKNFLQAFESRKKQILLKIKKNDQIKDQFRIDMKTVVMAKILESMKKFNIFTGRLKEFFNLDMEGYISYEDIENFLKNISCPLNKKEIDLIFSYLDKDNLRKIEFKEFKFHLDESSIVVRTFKNLTSENEDDAAKENSELLKHQIEHLFEKMKIQDFKRIQQKKRIDDLETMNNHLQQTIEDYDNRYLKLSEKYLLSTEELAKIKSTFDMSMTKEDARKLEEHSDKLFREVNVLRVGLNTFKELYKSSNRQIQILNIKSTRNIDELDTYKKAIKDLQSESNTQAIIGKLYYSLLVSRWREAASLQKYDDFITEFNSLREENMRCDNEYRTIYKDYTEVQAIYYDKLIENVKLNDALENYIKPVISLKDYEEMKDLLNSLSSEKIGLTEKYMEIRQENNLLLKKNDELSHKMDYCDALTERLKLENTSDVSKKIIDLSNEIMNLKLSESKSRRDKSILEENEKYFKVLNENYLNNLKKIELSNAELESKFRIAEEIWRKKDEERQRKLFSQLKGITLSDLRSNANQGVSNVNKIQNNKDAETVEKLNKTIKDLELKLKISNEMLESKTNQLKNYEEIKLEHGDLRNQEGLFSLVTKNQMELIHDDETKKIAATAHKTITTLREVISMKNAQLQRKDEIISSLNKDIVANNSFHLVKIQELQNQIASENQSTMRKLRSVLENINTTSVIKITKNSLATMTLADIENLIDDKDKLIQDLAIELKGVKEENEINYLKYSDVMKRMTQLETELTEERMKNGKEEQMKEIQKMRKVIEEKTQLIEEERKRIYLLREEFSKKLGERQFLEDEILKNSVHVPERLVEKSEKEELYIKIQNLRLQMNKIKNENDKLKKVKEEYDKKADEFEKKKISLMNENKLLLTAQVNDTKTISRLTKEKEELKEKLKDLKIQTNPMRNTNTHDEVTRKIEENKLSESKIIESNAENIIPPINNIRTSSNFNKPNVQISNSNITTKQRNPSTGKFTKKGNEPINIQILKSQQNEQKIQEELSKKKQNILGGNQNQVKTEIREEETPEAVLKRLVYYCVKKNINMQRHLLRYDITKLGKINQPDFSKAIDELKLGFIENDIRKLIDKSKSNDNFIIIKNFVDLMTSVDQTYETIMKENEFIFEEKERKITKKYDPFSSKHFNINY